MLSIWYYPYSNYYVRAIYIDDANTYLGIPVGPMNNANNEMVDIVSVKLTNLSKALLKPKVTCVKISPNSKLSTSISLYSFDLNIS